MSPAESLVLASDRFRREDESFGSTSLQVREGQSTVLHGRPSVGEVTEAEIMERESEASPERLGPVLSALAFMFFASGAFLVERAEEFVDGFEEPVISPFWSRPVRHSRSLGTEGVCHVSVAGTQKIIELIVRPRRFSARSVRARRPQSCEASKLPCTAVRPASITSIVRALVAGVSVCALLTALLLLVRLPEIAVPFLLATTIGFGLIVVALAWRAITQRHPDSK